MYFLVLRMLKWVGFTRITEKEGLQLISEAASCDTFFSTMAKMTPLNYLLIFQDKSKTFYLI